MGFLWAALVVGLVPFIAVLGISARGYERKSLLRNCRSRSRRARSSSLIRAPQASSYPLVRANSKP
jgi:heme exporter protein D